MFYIISKIMDYKGKNPMKTKILLFIILSILIAVAFCGCLDNAEKVKIVSWGIETQRYNLTGGWEKVGNGFIHDVDGSYQFIVGGHAQNIADKPLQRVEIIFKFYDENDDYLGSLSDYEFSVEKGETFTFYVYVQSYLDYFYDINDVDFEINAE